MQNSFESLALEHYAGFIHKQARIYYNQYGPCARIGVIDYEDFHQEAVLGFLLALRTLNVNTFPVPPKAIVFAKQFIRSLIFRNVVLRFDGIHRQPPSSVSKKITVSVLSTPLKEDESLLFTADKASTYDDVDFFATIEKLPPQLSTVAVCMVNGLSVREIERRRIMPRRVARHAVERLRKLFSEDFI